MIVEDAQWADQATLDVLRLLGRRIPSLPVLAVVTYREEANADVDALRVALGDLAGAAGVSRLTLAPLPREAVRLAAGARHRRGRALPPHVRQPVLRHRSHRDGRQRGARDRPRRRDGARRAARARRVASVFEVIASVPPAVESWLLDAVCGTCAETVAPAWRAGMIVASGTGDRVPARDRARGGRATGSPRSAGEESTAASSRPSRRPPMPDPARLAHHADAPATIAAVVMLHRGGGERAAAVGAHRQAAAQYGTALPRPGTGRAPSGRLLTPSAPRRCYAADEQVGSIADLYEAIALHRRRAMSAARPARRACSCPG